jgi:hypothetical protein
MTELPESAPDLSTEALTQRLEDGLKTAMFSGRTISVLGLLQIGIILCGFV